MNSYAHSKTTALDWYLIGIIVLASSLVLSPFMMSVAQIMLLVVWMLEGVSFGEIEGDNKIKVFFVMLGRNIAHKMRCFVRCRLAVLLVALYLIHLVGVIYSSDMSYALHVLKLRLPLLLLPIIFSTMPALTRRQADLVFLFYVISVWIGTVFSFVAYIKGSYNDIREISLFISHIRFCLSIVFAIFVVLYYLVTTNMSLWQRAASLFVVLWFCYILNIFESLAGYVILALAAMVSVIYILFRRRRNRVIIGVSLSLLTAVVIASTVLLCRVMDELIFPEPIDISTLDKTTSRGNAYRHDTVMWGVEDGQYVGLYVCMSELREAWDARSSCPFWGETMSGESVQATLIRYLASKGLRKDADGVAALDDQDRHNIEQGIANYHYLEDNGVKVRLSKVAFELSRYIRKNDPNGGSLSQRFEYTRASLFLIAKNPWFGVGTGDLPNAFNAAYEEMDSPLKQEYRHRAHNQYLSMAVAFGLPGLALFLVILFYPYLSSKRYRSYLYTIFLTIMLLSMLPEDTIDSQAGATLFALFNALFLFAVPDCYDDECVRWIADDNECKNNT